MDVYPVKFEAYECGDPVFKVSAFDECTANVEISIPVNVESWKEVSAEIEKCLQAMRLE